MTASPPGRDFADTAELKHKSVVHLDEAMARAIATAVQEAPVVVTSVQEKPYTRRPSAPFTTSTLQQEASRKLRLSSKNAMRVAQRLYENGYITYMRTDCITLSESAITAARSQARDLYGADYVPAEPRRYAGKVKNAQEAHEAIRPAGDRFRTPAQVAGELRGDEFALYELIWKRTVASQMADARGSTATVKLDGDAGRRRGRADRGVHRERHRHHLPRLPRRLRGGPRRDRRQEAQGDRRGGAPSAEARRRRAARGDPRRGRRSRDPAAAALHRGDPRESHGGEGDRAPVDVCVDHGHDPGPWLRGHPRQRPGPDLAGLRRDAAARGALPAAGRLRLHRLHGGGPRPDRQRRRAAGRLAASGSTSATRRARPRGSSSSSTTSARSTPARSRRSRSATGWSSASVATDRTSRRSPRPASTREPARCSSTRRRRCPRRRAAPRSTTTSPPTR